MILSVTAAVRHTTLRMAFHATQGNLFGKRFGRRMKRKRDGGKATHVALMSVPVANAIVVVLARLLPIESKQPFFHEFVVERALLFLDQAPMLFDLDLL